MVLAAVVAAVAGLTTWAQLVSSDSPEIWTFKVIAAYPHDPAAFTQGLALHEGELYEGTGQYGASSVRKVDLATGRVEKQRALNPRYFGEGIAILGRPALSAHLAESNRRSFTTSLPSNTCKLFRIAGRAGDSRTTARI